ncbi:uncharacterized protein [Typha angustifolia]|uniref:uncharacterized protein n=1 Tax=Typha angustifolia TaxID=59011 RepID=UPI003C2BE2F9
MRIRRRPLPPSTVPDPSDQLHSPNGGLDDSKERVSVIGGGREGGEGLHPNRDLPTFPLGLGNDTSKMAFQDPPVLDPTYLQVIMEEEKGEEEMVDSSTQVNSNKRKGSKRRERGSSSLEMKEKVKPNSSKKNGCTEANGSESKTCDIDVLVVKDGKKRRSPAMLMEGSRCSRVNGRGWRCCQQTLVGYSLCEHHLGKGRLRSMSSVRGQLGTTKRETSQQPQLSGVDVEEEEEEEEMDEEVKGARKTAKKIGMVKARSINSLLGEDDKYFGRAERMV